MKTRLLSVLLLTAAFPLAAVAQDTGTSSDGTTGTSQMQPADDMNSTTGTGTNDNSGASTTQQDSTTPSVSPTSPSDSGSTMDSGSSAMDSGNATVPGQSTTGSMASAETFVTVPESGAWRVSDLQGKAVYGSDGASIGDIKDVLVSQDGSVNAVIIGVGGFLGIGEKDVAVNMGALQLGPGDTQAQANAASSALPDPTGATGAVSGDAAPAPTTGMDGTTTNQTTGDMAANNAASGASIGDDGLPDRIILNVTREQLEQAPAFEGVRAATQP
ncbi:hypothetical protein ANOBCDAF_00823 [Pleomorphomonas sp. T1.2MG-36]|uniref:PRC-barrel domain-containing protein n=1 Tax=Pleomorphomonas sp. T1.2MG-36 TaxID=3041167 RepID=UPI0024777FC6|nr:PRC-barrel domain-containing protein [Pleomorphomonas sp. T1.2MG-36]CAI9402033.1 hypothetical protein ANOBCDAF_00823 [Pleomorphomonas sp. T1.2MG-36]